MSFQSTALLLAWIAIVLLAFGLSGLLRQIHRLTWNQAQGMALSSGAGEVALGPAVGASAPALVATSAWVKPTLLLFAEKGCSSCRRLIPELEALVVAGVDANVKVLFRNEADKETPAGVDVLTHEASTFQRFQIPITPYAVAIDSDGVIRGASPLGSTARLRVFLEEAFMNRTVGQEAT